ncbi:peptidase inhibitor family I36 protein [Streptomyces sp. NEAU-S77]|uniref:peptidase inhibitor family I36 protein n=1 Tax=Streptomyces sp. NEAU-S77 TaxID=3411033 RepID=UPI003BA257EE
MSITIRTALAAVALVGGTALAAVPAASAADSAPAARSAQAGGFHMYQHDNYKGGWAYVTGTDKYLRDNDWDRGGSVDNSTSSVKNQTRKYVDMYQNGRNRQNRCTGAHTTSYPGTNDRNLSNDAIKDNRLSCVIFR